ncbi:MAG: DUF4442 domain-containing protein [Candidatus Marinimicrobia bacterium]|jgi:acyl-coenzyme A thioesterase PaaI-like protein|nr:DUF4442 domain-containing protein [Candidatus Neomarinimicrobiota bacterium]MDP6853326.1 DUF4442 domain-containing protein [Candidatus Neomarinimicrobiota bacterium]MDP6936898.1 DUF4442 domain-containing protein [Candidatus Neomarinimicrobiota bacterium]
MAGLISAETKATWQLKLFGLLKIPLIYFCKPKIIRIDDSGLEVRIKLTRRTRNHLNSMYFGVLSVGADVTGGFLAMIRIRESKSPVALIFKDFKADFLKRAEGDVHFACNDGNGITDLVNKAVQTGERQSMPVHITATVPSVSDEPVAKFILTLSLKLKG